MICGRITSKICCRIGTQSNTIKVMPTSEESTPAAATVTVRTAQTTKNPTVSLTDSGHGGSTTSTTKHSEITTTDGKITTVIDNSLKHFSVTTTSSRPSTTLSGHAELQADQDRSDNDLQILSQHSLLQVAISSLVVLAAVCIAVCAIMVTLFIMACKRNRAQISSKKLSQDGEVHETQDAQEYSFVEI